MNSPSGPSSPVSPRTLSDLVTCPVCLDTYRDPKTLTCLHTFCANCLENCRRPFSLEIACPVCSRRTPLSPRGIMGLQSDFRVQQIQDILTLNGKHVPTDSMNDDKSKKFCDLCKSESRNLEARSHCIQCFMFFCEQCLDKHANNSIFVGHHVVSLVDTNAAETLFCKSHRDHPVRYFCKVCKLLLCTICVMGHDPAHKPEPLEKGIIEKYRQELQQSLKLVHSKLTEIKSKGKYLEVIRQSHQVSLNEVQVMIKQRTEDLIAAIRQQEAKLLSDVQQRMDAKLLEYGMDNLDEIRLKKFHIEGLFNDVQSAISGSPQQCLLAYEQLVSRIQTVVQSSVPAVKTNGNIAVVKFIPSDDMNIVIGKLQESTIRNDSDRELFDSVEVNSEHAHCPAENLKQFGGQNICPNSPERGNVAPSEENVTPNKVTMRRATVLSAMSGASKKQLKYRKMKGSNSNQLYEGTANCSTSDNVKVNSSVFSTTVKSIFGNSTSVLSSSAMLGNDMSTVTSTISETANSASSFTNSPRSEALRLHIASVQSPKLLFSIDRTGGWTGKLESPQSLAFLPDGNIVLAECSNLASRLQVFDRNGSSVRLMAWGQVQPYGIAVSSDGIIYVADRRDRCVKVLSMEGVFLWSWHGRISLPYAVAASANGNVVVTDTESKTVTIFGNDGTVLNQFGSWGSADAQFMQPSGVAIDVQENIYISDTINQCVQVFDKTGAFLRRVKLGATCALAAVPDGIACDRKGRLFLCDRDRNVVSMLTADGRQVPVIKGQGALKYPVALAIDKDDRLAIIESHSSFLSPDQHCGFKVYQLS